MTTTAHVYFADVPLSPVAASQEEGHRSSSACDDDAMLQEHQKRDRSVSPVAAPPDCSSPALSSPRFERNMGFFRQLSRRFGLRSNDDLVYSGSNEDDNQSSSTDSCSSAHAAAVKGGNCSKELPKQFTSCNSSETSSTVDIEEQQLQLQKDQQSALQTSSQTDTDATCHNDANGEEEKPLSCHKDRKSFARSSFSRLQRRSTNSIRRAFEAFSLSSRSLSCSGATPPPPPLTLSSHTQSHTSSASSSTNNGTPIKSALKSSSNLELNKKSATFAAGANPSSFSTTSSSVSASASASSSSAAVKATSSSASKTKTKPPPQRILRQPVSYTYLKGISGLPTQRVPRSSVCCQYVRR